MPTSRYYDVKNPKYIESDSQSMTMSSESTTTSEDTDEKKETKEKIEKTQNDSTQYTVSNPLNQFEGLTQAEKIKKSEEMLRRLWKRPHSSWDKITTVTSITTEKTTTDGQVTDEVNREVDHNIDKIIYDVPLDYCHLRVPRNRTTRSCPDPWRRHGAHVKLCEIGGWMPESRNKNARVTPIRKGSIPPPAPRTKPLQNMEDYLKAMKK
uniref:NT-3 n=2 Tax=Caenorhabditis tropicalis TaxID=1561998 RepID=A0A1I7TK79_9PELO